MFKLLKKQTRTFRLPGVFRYALQLLSRHNDAIIIGLL